MAWFTKLTGIDEESPAQVRQELSVDGQHLVCPDGKRIAFGRFETPTLSELRKAVTDLNSTQNARRFAKSSATSASCTQTRPVRTRCSKSRRNSICWK